MDILIGRDLKKANPNLSLGVIDAEVIVEKGTKKLWKKINAFIEMKIASLSLEELRRDPEIVAIRETYRKLGKEPSRYRGSSEALLRRIIQGKGLV